MERLGAESVLKHHRPAVKWGPTSLQAAVVRRAVLGGVGSRPSCTGSPSEQRTLLLPCQSVPEVDPAATMPRSQPQQRTSAGSYPSPPPAPYSAPQAPALSVTGPITASSEQVLAYFQATGEPADCPHPPFQGTRTEASQMHDTQMEGPSPPLRGLTVE